MSLSRTNEPVIRWLLEEDQPSVRYFALKDLVSMSENLSEVVEARRRIPEAGWAREILSKQKGGCYWESTKDL